MTYSYICKVCGKKFDVIKGINEDVKVKCPVCGSENIKRIFAPIGTVVNCTGFYGKSK